MAINSNASTVYEACGFGYTLHYQLLTAGAHNLVIGRWCWIRNAAVKTTA